MGPRTCELACELQALCLPLLSKASSSVLGLSWAELATWLGLCQALQITLLQPFTDFFGHFQSSSKRLQAFAKFRSLGRSPQIGRQTPFGTSVFDAIRISTRIRAARADASFD